MQTITDGKQESGQPGILTIGSGVKTSLARNLGPAGVGVAADCVVAATVAAEEPPKDVPLRTALENCKRGHVDAYRNDGGNIHQGETSQRVLLES
ncbi:hypothetical protein MRX96_016361 [Rhipicephalus microplus]